MVHKWSQIGDLQYQWADLPYADEVSSQVEIWKTWVKNRWVVLYEEKNLKLKQGGGEGR